MENFISQPPHEQAPLHVWLVGIRAIIVGKVDKFLLKLDEFSR
jgi:hypothetical protein